ncbi:voltage-gated chloride channel protein [Anaerobacillus alkaliphilus]|uniref:Voltage-gated chloride channel protein n=1 Tax=Anaerobacillus alkaliphilus TaxID=1548597 RepID=A0A4Q0VWX8_9BACI|nr:voltage-gated chloride channel family protein [Anaerobacillus alkaliphilus]RXJ04154.1 voltage-gated chloride channel protein [Anaerobacillus alkaliphilus]
MKQINQSTTFLLLLIKWIVSGTVIGLVVGSTTALLLTTNDFLGETRQAHPGLIYFLPLGGVLIGYLYQVHGKASAKGNNLILDQIHGKGKIDRRIGPLVYIGTFITVLFGGSTGREGAAIQMGGSVAESVNRLFKVSPLDTNLLIMAGISSGFGAAFGAPITGAVFGMEMASLGRLRYEAIVPCITASFVGHLTTSQTWGVEHEHFIIKQVPELTTATFIKFFIVCILFSVISILYCQLRHYLQMFSEKHLKSHMLRGFVGGVIIVALMLIVGSYEYNGRGLEMIEQSFTGEVPPFAFLAKLIFTAVTMGFGFVGGEAIPLFFVGSTLGNTLSTIVGLPTSFLAAIGLIAVFCGGANTPIASFLLAMEMFDGEGLEYFFLACIISYIFSGHHGLWPSQKVYDPKSRLQNFPTGKTIATIAKQLEKGTDQKDQ